MKSILKLWFKKGEDYLLYRVLEQDTEILSRGEDFPGNLNSSSFPFLRSDCIGIRGLNEENDDKVFILQPVARSINDYQEMVVDSLNKYFDEYCYSDYGVCKIAYKIKNGTLIYPTEVRSIHDTAFVKPEPVKIQVSVGAIAGEETMEVSI